MLIVMKAHASDEEIHEVCNAIKRMGFESQPMPGGQRTAIGLIGNDQRVDASQIQGLPGIQEVIHVSAPYKQVSKEWQSTPTCITLGNGVTIGGENVVVMGGPCAVENEAQIMSAAKYVADSGGVILRGGAFKPRTSPYSFQGLGEDGLKLLARARDAFGLAIVTEAVDIESATLVAKYSDIIQIGARNMQNYSLLKHVGRLRKPILLKRGMCATIKEWLLAAEYVVNEGNPEVILCERGIRSFDSSTRNVLDIGALVMAKSLTHLPVIADPSHGTGRREMILPVARAAVAAGADGLIIETHPNPNQALSDGAQSLFPDEFKELMEAIAQIAGVLDRPLAALPKNRTKKIHLRSVSA